MPAYSYPHTIDNGHGERLTFLRRVKTANGDRLEGENTVAPGVGPVMHVHYHQDEVFTVREGRMGYQRLGEPEQFAGPGETVPFLRGEPHRFWNAGDTDLKCSGYIEPADNIEYFLGSLFESQRENGSLRPKVFDGAFLARHFRSEYATFAIPTAIQQLIFPIVVAVGTLTGRYAKYADAPKAVGR